MTTRDTRTLRGVLVAASLLAVLLHGGAFPVNAASSAAAPGISFRAPRDFATGAVPSSAAYNAASGDQAAHLITRVPHSDHVAVGDFDHDGRADVAQTNVVAGSLSVFIGDGAGSFSAPALYTVGTQPIFVLAHDLDVDGHVDLLVANLGSNDLALLRGRGDGTFMPASFVPVPQPRNVAVGNFDGDPLPDLAVASAGPAVTTSSPAGGVVILLGDRSPIGLRAAQVLTHTSSGQQVRANSVAVGNFDGRAFDDLAVGIGASRNAHDRSPSGGELTGDDVVIHLNTGDPTEPFPSRPSHSPIRVGAGPDSIAAGDLDADADVDLAVMDTLSADITTLAGDGAGRFAVRAVNLTVGGLPRSVSTGDFDGDGVTDLVTANFFSSTIAVLDGNGDGTFQPAVEFWSGPSTTSAAVGDFDGDGRLDVVVGRLRDDELGLLVNDSPQLGDGVEIRRDLPYGSPTDPVNDPFAAHHALDVYVPPPGTPSLAGAGKRFPVLLFAHGAGISADKTMVGYLMRSLAREGIVAVSTDYRLGAGMADQQTQDIAQAFRFVRDDISAVVRCADPANLFVSGHSAGAHLVARLATESRWADEQRAIRGMVILSSPGDGVVPTSSQPPSILVSSTEGLDVVSTVESAEFAAASAAVGASSRHLVVPGRDHFTNVSMIARPNDPSRLAILDFMRRTLVPAAGCSALDAGVPVLPDTR